MNRRLFVKGAAAIGGSFFLNQALAEIDPNWKNHIGLELYTVRDLLPKDYEGTLAKVAEIGYKEIEPATDYAGKDPKAFRAMCDKLGLTVPSTHVGAQEGPDLEKQLEGFQIMGIKYTEVRGPRTAGGGGGTGPTTESIKRQASELNRHGEMVKKFGMKMLIHNHTGEFTPLIDDATKKPYDILLAEIDPALVAMQLDIGWASVAGQNILQMFQKNPGRFELWHVKDATGIAAMGRGMTQPERQKAAKLVPVAMGEIDYFSIFNNAKLAGMKHFCVEQDSAIEGDSMAAARKSYENLHRMLS